MEASDKLIFLLELPLKVGDLQVGGDVVLRLGYVGVARGDDFLRERTRDQVIGVDYLGGDLLVRVDGCGARGISHSSGLAWS